MMKYVAGPFSFNATGRELGRKVSSNDGQPPVYVNNLNASSSSKWPQSLKVLGENEIL